MDISVIIPTYRRPQLLVNCLDKLLRQSIEPECYEIIVVCDGPDKETFELVKSITQASAVRIRCFALPEKKGPAAARNFGWLNARGNIIAFTDDDCLADEDWLSAILHTMNHNDAEAITGKVIVPRPKRPTDYEKNTAGLETADFITANCACTKKALTAIGGFDERYKVAWREDSDLEFKFISKNINIERVADAIVVHPVRKANWGISMGEQRKGQYNALLYKKFPELYRKKIQPLPPLLYYAVLIAFIIMLAGYIMNAELFAVVGLCCWLVLIIKFIVQRLYCTRLTIGHIAEMAVTSLVIPFLSIYWQWYGAFKYKVLFI